MESITESAPYHKVVVHPLVLLSAVDHFNRLGHVTGKQRALGALLGSTKIIDGKRIIDVSNSFAIPFDEDSKDTSVWYLDHDYLDTMFHMFRNVNAKERIVGWYHTGPELRTNDTEINDIFKKYTPNAILTVVETTTNDWSLPTRAYYCMEEVNDDGRPSTKTFHHLNSEIGAEEAEEVGVEHLLRDVFNNTQGTLSQKIVAQINGLKGFGQKLEEIQKYLGDVAENKLPMNYKIIYGLQDIFNLIPDVVGPGFNKAMQMITNDQMLIVYLASIVKSVISLHNLIDNKLNIKDQEVEEEKKEEDKRNAKQAEKDKAAAKKNEKDEESGDKAEPKKGQNSKKSSTKPNEKNDTSAKRSKLEFYQNQLANISCRLTLPQSSVPKSPESSLRV